MREFGSGLVWVLVLVKSIARARPQLDVRPGRQRVFLMSPKEVNARAGLWSLLGVLLIKIIARARPPLDVRNLNGTHHSDSDLQDPALQVSAIHSSALRHAVFLANVGRHLRGRTIRLLFLKEKTLASACLGGHRRRLQDWHGRRLQDWHGRRHHEVARELVFRFPSTRRSGAK